MSCYLIQNCGERSHAQRVVVGYRDVMLCRKVGGKADVASPLT